MPRRNRQKLHREQRLKAEAQKRLRREVRLRRQEDAERARLSAARALSGGPVVRAAGQAQAGVELQVKSILDLLRLASVARPLSKKVVRLCRALHPHLPNLARVDQLPWMLLLAIPSWVRTPETWTPPSGSARRKRDHLAEHLLTRYPVPPFLLRALDVDPLAVARVPVEDEWAVQLLAHVGRGGSVRQLVHTSVLPAPLTRRMVHLLLSAKADSTPVRALRAAQVQGHSGPRWLHKVLIDTRLGELRGPDVHLGEPFWHEVIGWLCRLKGLHSLGPADLDDVLGWVEHHQRLALSASSVFVLKGRTAASVLRDVAVWRRSLTRSEGAAFPASGLLPLEAAGWSFIEIDSPAALDQEGQAMAHCVWAYKKLASRRKVALFSLRKHGERRATVEVALGAGQVVQAKRKANAAIDRSERAIVERWAALNRLRVCL